MLQSTMKLMFYGWLLVCKTTHATPLPALIWWFWFCQTLLVNMVWLCWSFTLLYDYVSCRCLLSICHMLLKLLLLWLALLLLQLLSCRFWYVINVMVELCCFCSQCGWFVAHAVAVRSCCCCCRQVANIWVCSFDLVLLLLCLVIVVKSFLLV